MRRRNEAEDDLSSRPFGSCLLSVQGSKEREANAQQAREPECSVAQILPELTAAMPRQKQRNARPTGRYGGFESNRGGEYQRNYMRRQAISPRCWSEHGWSDFNFNWFSIHSAMNLNQASDNPMSGELRNKRSRSSAPKRIWGNNRKCKARSPNFAPRVGVRKVGEPSSICSPPPSPRQPQVS